MTDKQAIWELRVALQALVELAAGSIEGMSEDEYCNKEATLIENAQTVLNLTMENDNV